MIFVRLFLIFCKIGIFTFGGGYSMESLQSCDRRVRPRLV